MKPRYYVDYYDEVFTENYTASDGFFSTVTTKFWGIFDRETKQQIQIPINILEKYFQGHIHKIGNVTVEFSPDIADMKNIANIMNQDHEAYMLEMKQYLGYKYQLMLIRNWMKKVYRDMHKDSI